MTTTNAANSSPITAECAANTPNEWAPKRIWLQRGVGEGGSHTWCEDSQEPEHEEASYIREDFAGTLSADYLSGHQDGLDWAALVVEYTDPRTGDWMYDDPHDLAKAIRKGPDMSAYQSAPSAPQQAGGGLTVALRNELITQICEHTDSSRTWAESIVNNAVRKTRLLAAPRQPGEMGAGVNARNAGLEEAARLIETTRETTTIEGGGETKRHLTLRKSSGDLTGMTWVAGIRALMTAPAASAQQDEREAEWLTSKWCTVCKGATCLPGMHGLSEAVKQHVIAEFLQCTGQYVTNNASREAAIADAISKLPARTFEQAWAEKERQGYKYGNDALECVRMGWDMACASKPHAAQQVQADAGAVAMPVAFWNPAVDHDSAAFSYGQGGGYDVPLYAQPAGESDKRERFERFERIKRLALDAGGQGALPVPASLSKIVRECLDGIAAMSREQSGEKGGERG